MSLLGLIGLDSSKDLAPRSLKSTAPTSAPPPPPPKNAARMLALALTESAQQVSIQSQSSEPPTPGSPLQSQEASNIQDLPHPLIPHSSKEGTGRGYSPPPISTSPTVTIASSYPSTSSPRVQQQPLGLTSTITKPSDSTRSSTSPPGTPLHTESSPPDTPLYKSTPISSSTSLTFPTRKSPERQQPVATQVPLCSSSSSASPATSPSDTGVFSQPVTEVSVKSYLLINYSLFGWPLDVKW